MDRDRGADAAREEVFDNETRGEIHNEIQQFLLQLEEKYGGPITLRPQDVSDLKSMQKDEYIREALEHGLLRIEKLEQAEYALEFVSQITLARGSRRECAVRDALDRIRLELEAQKTREYKYAMTFNSFVQNEQNRLYIAKKALEEIFSNGIQNYRGLFTGHAAEGLSCTVYSSRDLRDQESLTPDECKALALRHEVEDLIAMSGGNAGTLFQKLHKRWVNKAFGRDPRLPTTSPGETDPYLAPGDDPDDVPF